MVVPVGSPHRLHVLLVSRSAFLESDLAAALGPAATVTRSHQLPGHPGTESVAFAPDLDAVVIEDGDGLEAHEVAASLHRAHPGLTVVLYDGQTSLDTVAADIRARQARVEPSRERHPTPRPHSSNGAHRERARPTPQPPPTPPEPAPEPEGRATGSDDVSVEDGWLGRAIAGWTERYGLTAAELAVCERSIQGLSNKEIAGAIGVSVSTVRTHLASVCSKLGLGSRGEVAYSAMQELHEAARRQAASFCARPHGLAPVRRRVLIASSNVCLRSHVLEVLDGSELYGALVADEPAALAILRASSPVHAVVLDADPEARSPELLDLALARATPPRLIFVGRSNAAPDLAAHDVLELPFRGNELLKRLS